MAQDEEDLEGIDPNDELYAVAPMRARKMISFDWGAGYVSPFRPTDDQRAEAIMSCAGASSLPKLSVLMIQARS